MMNHPWLAVPGLLLLSLHLALATPTLKIGDPAPEIKVAKWIKGQPVEKLGGGSVQVVEFWATWCGPCRQSAPELSKLAEKFDGKARIIGVSIWEREKTDHEKRLKAVGDFVATMGDKMAYIVAADDNDGSMAKNWMAAAEENGIPTAFIVGKDGRIAWIGYPWDGLDEKLEKVIAGTLDLKAIEAEVIQRQSKENTREAEMALFKPVRDLQSQHKPQEAMAALDHLIAEHPEWAVGADFTRFDLLLSYDEVAANTLARQALEGGLKDDAGALYAMAYKLMVEPGLKHHDWDLIVAIAKRAADLHHKTDAATMRILAGAWHGRGDLNKAVETAQTALKLAETDSDFSGGDKAFLIAELKSYKAAQDKAAQPVPAVK